MNHSLLKAIKTTIVTVLITAGFSVDSALKAQSMITLVGNDTICAGDSVKAYATTSRLSGVSYSWADSLGGTTSLSATNDTAWLMPTVSTTYRVIGDSSGVKDTAFKAIVVLTLPTVSFSTSSDTVCSKDTVTIKGSGASMYSYFRSSGAAAGSGDSALVIMTGADSLYVVGTDSKGCANSAGKKIEVKSLPVVRFKVYVQGFYSLGENACANQDFELKATPGHTSYSWSSAGTIKGSKTDSTIIGNTGIASIYSVMVTGVNGCSTTANQLIRVTQQPTTGVKINLVGANTDTVLCGGESRQATASAGQLYRWSPASAIVGGNVTSNQVTLRPASDATITLTGIFAGCITSDEIILRVSQLPTLSFVSQTSSSTNPLCEGAGDEIVVTSNSNKIQWNTIFSSRKKKTFAFKKTTTFKITAYNELDCATEITVTSYVDTSCVEGDRISTEEFTYENLNVFYNAESQNLIVSSENAQGIASMMVVDMSGNEVLSNTIELVPNSTLEFDFSPLSSGAYLFKIVGDQGQLTRKFIKH